uniref:Uncharacterized protein n=1 Tax=Fagus sylvatica TaxID=28930 RepID=A0A2N9FFD9_FAGSY
MTRFLPARIFSVSVLGYDCCAVHLDLRANPSGVQMDIPRVEKDRTRTPIDVPFSPTRSTRLRLTISFRLRVLQRISRASIPYFTGRKRTRNEGVMSKTVKIGPTLSQILLSVVGKTAYLGGSVCMEIPSSPQRLGPRAENLKQEGYFSCNVQLLDRQELPRSSRNLDQKMTPWHKEHSNGLRSQDHILRTQARLYARHVPLENRVFLTRNKLIYKPGCVGKKTHSCTTRNSRIAKNLPGLAGIPIGKMSSNGPKTPRWPLFAGPYLTSPSSDSRKSGTLQKVFPTRNKLIREPGCVGKITTPATTWNSRFAKNIPRLTGIFAGRTHKNSSGTPTSGSRNSLVRTPIRANFIP